MSKSNIVMALFAGIILTSFSLLYMRPGVPKTAKYEFPTYFRGLPLSYSKIIGGTGCGGEGYDDSISVYWRGNCGHEEYLRNLIVDLIFWSGLSAALIYFITKNNKVKT